MGDRAQARGAVELLDSSVYLLRSSGPRYLLPWLVGTAPFVVAVPTFVFVMRVSALAGDQLLGASFLLAALYIWMKVWQCVFAMRLRTLLAGFERAAPTLGEWLNISAVQARLQPTLLILLPLAAMLVIPFGWVYAYYHNLSVTGEARSARRQAALWPTQNHRIIGAIAIFSIVVFANVLSAIMLLPWFLRTFFGVENVLTQSADLLLNGDTIVIAVALSYLILGPIVKTVYVLRCHDGDSINSGADLLQQLAAIKETMDIKTYES